VMVADVKAMSVIAVDQLALGHPACAGVGCAGGSVVTLKARLPFLISLAGSDWLPVTVASPGFWPGAWLPPWFVHVVVGSAVAVSVISTSPLPRPARDPLAFRTSPWSANCGDPQRPPRLGRTHPRALDTSTPYETKGALELRRSLLMPSFAGHQRRDRALVPIAQWEHLYRYEIPD
jgi:hypothetical protein